MRRVLLVLAGCALVLGLGVVLSHGTPSVAQTTAGACASPVASPAASPMASPTASPAACGTPAASTVLVRTDPKLGKFLTDAQGRTLYVFKKDTPNTSQCSGRCATIWPPFTASGTLSLPAGVGGALGTITRADGTMQVTYEGMPLYRYAADAQPGDTKGQGIGGVWSVAAPM